MKIQVKTKNLCWNVARREEKQKQNIVPTSRHAAEFSSQNETTIQPLPLRVTQKKKRRENNYAQT